MGHKGSYKVNDDKKSNTGIYIGVGVGIVVLIIIILIILIVTDQISIVGRNEKDSGDVVV